jgi:hypothetical protein
VTVNFLLRNGDGDFTGTLQVTDGSAATVNVQLTASARLCASLQQ